MSDREAFEKWYMSRGWVDTVDPLVQDDHGAYTVTETCEAWQAWQAAQYQALLEVIRNDGYTTPQPVVPEGFSLIANEILDRFPEINSSNYSHDDVDRLNAWGIELVLSAGKGGE